MKRKNFGIVLLSFFALAFVLSSCKSNDPVIPPAETSYELVVKDVLGVTGTATFIETSSSSATIEIVLTGAPVGTHPAELCMNSAVEGGIVVVALNPVDNFGKSSTTITNLTYKQLLVYDGFVQVRKSSDEPNVILAIGDIGGNVITITQKSYDLIKIGAFGVSGTALFQKRMNGNTLLTISLAGTISGQQYPASINIGSIATVGVGFITATLNPVNGTTGKSYTNIKSLDSKIAIKYDEWLLYDGYINIYLDSAAKENIICQGNIGSN